MQATTSPDLTQHHLQQRVSEHFGFVPTRFMDTVVDATNTAAYTQLGALREWVEGESASGDAEQVLLVGGRVWLCVWLCVCVCVCVCVVVAVLLSG